MIFAGEGEKERLRNIYKRWEGWDGDSGFSDV
jgi:hypothetical protein